MDLIESSLIKKYENDIGDSIVEVGGNVNHETHYLPFLDKQILDQLIASDYVMDEVKKLIEIEANNRINGDEKLHQEIDEIPVEKGSGEIQLF